MRPPTRPTTHADAGSGVDIAAAVRELGDRIALVKAVIAGADRHRVLVASVLAVVANSAWRARYSQRSGCRIPRRRSRLRKDPPQGELRFDDASSPARPPTLPAGDGAAPTSTQRVPAETAGI